MAPQAVPPTETTMASDTPEKPNDVRPWIAVDNVEKTLEFWETAFGAETVQRFEAPDGTIVHSAVGLGRAYVQFGPADVPNPDMDPQMWEEFTAKPRYHGVALYIYVPDVEAVLAKAEEAGAPIFQPLKTEFWGDKTFTAADNNNIPVTFAERVEEVPDEEMARRAAEQMAQAGQA